jgi:integration host factor subunit beta
MTRSELIKKICASDNPFLEEEVSGALGIVFEALQKSLGEGLRVEIRDFGVLSLRTRSARRARNPRSGETVFLPEKKYIHFKMSKYLRQVMNEYGS